MAIPTAPNVVPNTKIPIICVLAAIIVVIKIMLFFSAVHNLGK
jgi:hypothetical protein